MKLHLHAELDLVMYETVICTACILLVKCGTGHNCRLHPAPPSHTCSPVNFHPGFQIHNDAERINLPPTWIFRMLYCQYYLTGVPPPMPFTGTCAFFSLPL